jgi:Amt family ammonium transporter
MASTVAEVDTRIDDLINDLDTWWLLFGAILVFFMQTGFAMLEVGSVSVKNTKNILIKNIGDASIGAMCWWLLGYGFAFGDDVGRFIGDSKFAFSTKSWGGDISGYDYASWLFQWAFAATAATIVSGAVAERVAFGAYVVYSIVLTSFIYPVVVHGGWSTGWASAFRSPTKDDLLFGCGVVDFAGSGVVHMTGGVAALVAAIVVGPRIGRFNEDGTANQLPQQSSVLQTLGTLILWFGWYGFNGVSTLYISGLSNVASKVMVTTTIGAASGALMVVILMKLKVGYWDAGAANNGILAGLVSITAGCSTVDVWAAMIIGLTGGMVYFLASQLLVKLRIDDVVDAIPVHMFCGAWGVIITSFFITKANYSNAYYATYYDADGNIEGEEGDRLDQCAGVFYKGTGASLGAAIVFVLYILAWVGGTCTFLFGLIDKTIGMRVSKDVEEIGMDDSKHGGQTYPEMQKQAGTSGAI